MDLQATIVRACGRAGQGGSPTAVLDDTGLSDDRRRAVPVAAGTSHAVFVSAAGRGPVGLRFFTATGELPACGHGTVAALAVLARRAGGERLEVALQAGGRTFTGEATASEAVFDPGPVEIRDADPSETEPLLLALGVEAAQCRIASVGRPRMLVGVPDREVLAGLAPDMQALRQACDRAGLLGCYVHSAPSPDGRAAARMFAPSIGVPEDVANANSTACLAAHLAGGRPATLRVDMGDWLGEPATVIATTRPGPRGPRVRVGGAAAVGPAVPLRIRSAP